MNSIVYLSLAALMPTWYKVGCQEMTRAAMAARSKAFAQANATSRKKCLSRQGMVEINTFANSTALLLGVCWKKSFAANYENSIQGKEVILCAALRKKSKCE